MHEPVDEQPICVVAVDAHRLVLRGLQASVAASQMAPLVRITGIAQDAIIGLQLVSDQDPDVVLVGLNLKNGACSFIQSVRDKFPETRIAVLGDQSELKFTNFAEFVGLGCTGFMLKDAADSPAEALIALAAGHCSMPADYLRSIVNRCSEVIQADEAQIAKGCELVGSLSAEHVDIWRLLTVNVSNQQIANILHVSERTAKRRVADLLKLLGVDSRSEAALLAVKVLSLVDDKDT